MIEDRKSEAYLERLVNESQFRKFLEEVLGPADEHAICHHPEGHSNETLFVEWGDRELVVRRPPPGETAEKAHDVLREHQIISALSDSVVPVPEPVFASDNPEVMGSEFYATERLRGDVIRGTEPERFATAAYRQAIGEELIETLVSIHSIDYEARDLDSIGRPNGFTERQVSRWRKQLEWAFERTDAVRSVPALMDVGDWLAANTPDSHGKALVHGDYKLDNVMFAPGTPPEITGVFDWELSTIGDPFTDVGWLLTFWHDSGDPEPPVPELMPTFMAREGYPSRAELVSQYEELRGVEIENARFYRVLAVFKLAALGEMFFRRHLEGNSDDMLYPKMEAAVPRLATRALRIIEGEHPL